MNANYSNLAEKSIIDPVLIPEAEYQAELRRLSDLAFAFLETADGDVFDAERLLDDCVDLLLEGGVLQMWRYRILLAQIREGL